MPLLPKGSPSPFESPIEKLIGEELCYHGLNVWPQYQVGILRTDMMVSSRLTDRKIIVECDSAIWHSEPLFDQFRDDILTEAGWEVIRFTGSDIMRCVKGCALNIIDLYFTELREQISYVEVKNNLLRQEGYYPEFLWYWRAGPSIKDLTGKEGRDAIRASLKGEDYILKNMVREFILKYSNCPEEYLRRLSEKGIL